MEAAHWVTATWDIDRPQAPPRKVYTLTQEGEAALTSWFAELENLRQMLDTVTKVYQQSCTL
jgi:DNA-binding PadR family transcriptional regulator